MEELDILQSKLASDVEAAKERVRAKLEADHAEKLKQAREEFQKEKEGLVRLHNIAKAEAVRAAEVAAVCQYKVSPSFGKILADAMTKTVIAVRKKVRPENPGVRWNTRAMVRHVQMWFGEKRSLESDSESEEEEEEARSDSGCRRGWGKDDHADAAQANAGDGSTNEQV
ncbi:unnamed protein product [Linum trigynum]|uniref:Uncharacterized protein n=1 Tax=Linum trigynum TaxID=586398 RepID=A0AAV2FTX5_9ROSI